MKLLQNRTSPEILLYKQIIIVLLTAFFTKLIEFQPATLLYRLLPWCWTLRKNLTGQKSAFSWIFLLFFLAIFLKIAKAIIRLCMACQSILKHLSTFHCFVVLAWKPTTQPSGCYVNGEELPMTQSLWSPDITLFSRLLRISTISASFCSSIAGSRVWCSPWSQTDRVLLFFF